jgi:hypothetical protein
MYNDISRPVAEVKTEAFGATDRIRGVSDGGTGTTGGAGLR